MRKAKKDSREVPIRQEFSVETYQTRSSGMSDIVVPHLRRATDEEKKAMIAAAQAYIDGKVELLGSTEKGHKNIQRRKHRFVKLGEGSRGNQVWKADECDLETKYIVGFKLRPRNDQYEETDWETGKAVVPRLFLSGADGSSGYIEFKTKVSAPKPKKESKSKGAKDGENVPAGQAPIPD